MKNNITYIIWIFLVLFGFQSLNGQIISKKRIESPENMIVHKIFYQSDSLKVNGYILEPKNGENIPVVISNRGGAYHYGAFTDSTAVRWNKFLVDAGYMVFATNYRGNMGSEGTEEYGTGDVDDSFNLLKIIDNYPRADSKSIGMYGFSRGGMVTYWALTKTDRLKAVAIGGDDGNVYEGYYNVQSVYDAIDPGIKYMWPDEEIRKKKLNYYRLEDR